MQPMENPFLGLHSMPQPGGPKPMDGNGPSTGQPMRPPRRQAGYGGRVFDTGTPMQRQPEPGPGGQP